jgi:glycosyltransferase involved in cell wall biosynthesis
MIRKRKIVFVVPDLQIGGAERQVVDLVNHLDRDRFDAILFTFDPTADLAATVNRDRVRLVGHPRRFRFDTRPIARLARIIREERVELVHCTLQMSLFMAHAAVLASGRALPLLDAIHTTRNRSWREELADRVLYLRLMNRCERVITVCESQRRFWASKYPSLASRMTTVYNGIDLDRYRVSEPPGAGDATLRRQLGIDDRDLAVALVAAIRPEKNHDGVLEAAARLVRTGHRIKFLFAGGAQARSEEERLARKTAALGLRDHVRWLGPLTDPRSVISAVDAGILFSTTESFPLTLLEFLAMGKPVVSSNVGGVPEIVEDGRNGVLVPAGDVDAFVSALARLEADRAHLRALAARARASVEARFSIRQMVRSTEDVIVDALNRGPGPVAPRS